MEQDRENTIFEDSFSEEVWAATYKDHNDNDINDTFRRVSNALASQETNVEEWSNNFYDLLTGFKATPGGRILSNAGTEWGGTTLCNCFVGTKPDYDQDSLDGIIETLRAQAKTLKSEGGWGMNFSFIRPRGSFIKGIGVETPGSIAFMEMFDKSSEIITSGSGLSKKNKTAKGKIRKGAQMSVLDCWHPDVEEFISAKLTPGRLTKFNLSVNMSDQFMEKIIKIHELQENEAPEEEIHRHDQWHLIFPDTEHPEYKQTWDGDIDYWISLGYPVLTYKTVSALDLWEQIMKSTYNRNDPGVLFLDRANKTHLWNYGGRAALVKATNPCGEQVLPFGSVCNLGSLNLTQFVNEELTDFDYEKISKYVPYLVRFLDNVNDITDAPLQAYIDSVRKRRRIGLGILGWASALIMMRIRFASDKAEEIKAKLMKCISSMAVNTSIDLAIEKGMFEGCDPEKCADHYFWKQINLPQEIVDRIRQYGMRNSALFSIQPTGNTSVMANVVSGGLEPIFLPEYIRTVIVPTVPEHIKDVTPKYWHGEFFETELFSFAKEGLDQILKGTDEFGTVYKIDKNRGLTKEVLCTDYGVRKLKESGLWNPEADWAVTTENLSAEDHVTDMKGWGIWLDSSASKTINLPNDYSYDDFKQIYLNVYKTGYLKGATTYRAGTMTTVLSSAKSEEPEQNTISRVSAPPERPKILPAKVFHPTSKDQRYYVIVGLLNNEVFEVFVGDNNHKTIPYGLEEASILKKTKGVYSLLHGKKQYILNVDLDPNLDALTRMISACLKSGCDIAYLVEQLERTKGNINVFAKIIARILKKFIPDGSKLNENCPECGSPLMRSEGCKRCTACEYSICG